MVLVLVLVLLMNMNLWGFNMNDCLVMETIRLVAVRDASAVELRYSAEKEAMNFPFLNL